MIIIYSYVSILFFKNAWVGDDAFIIFRSIEQLFAGRGPIWNPHERVQVFTSPLWYWLLSFFRILSPNLFLVSILVSYTLFIFTLMILNRIFKEKIIFILLILFVSSSNSFLDYTSSGLENCLSYLLFSIYIWKYLEMVDSIQKTEKPKIGIIFFLFSLIVCTRHDFFILLIPSLLYLLFIQWKNYSNWVWMKLLIINTSPILIWTLFSIVFYGFIFPNTSYAKLNTGIERAELIRQGGFYFLETFKFDPIVFFIIISSILFCLIYKCRNYLFSFSSGVFLYLFYILNIGGDFMAGRFFSIPYLVGIIILFLIFQEKILKRKKIFFSLVIVLVNYLTFYKHTPLNTPIRFKNISINHGITDERGFYFSIFSFNKQMKNIIQPNILQELELQKYLDKSSNIIVAENIGYFGYRSNLDKIIIDRFALSDPLLARLPSEKNWRIGHFPRNIPEGYIESITNDTEQIKDPIINEKYKSIRLLTQKKELFSIERIKKIILMNRGL